MSTIYRAFTGFAAISAAAAAAVDVAAYAASGGKVDDCPECCPCEEAKAREAALIMPAGPQEESPVIEFSAGAIVGEAVFQDVS